MRHAFLLLFLFAGVASADAPDPGVDSLDTALERPGVATSILLGRALLESGDVQGALPYYRNAWEGDPRPETGIRYAEVALMARKPSIALEVLGELHAADPTDVEVGVRLARLRATMGDLGSASALTDSLLAVAPDAPELLNLRLDLHDAEQEFDEALATVDRILEDRPGDASLHVRRGSYLLALNRPEEAEAAWRQALEIDPGSDEASAMLTEMLIAQGRQEEVVQELQRRVDEEVAGPRQKAALADLYLRLGRLDEAAAVLLPMASSGDLDREGELQLVQLLGDLGRQREALELLDRLEESEPGSTDTSAVRGELLLDLRDYDAAERELRSALEQDPTNNQARLSLLLVLTGRDPELLRANAPAGGEVRELVDTAAGQANPRSLREQFLVGAFYRRFEEWEKAARFLGRAAQLPGASEQVLFELAIAQQESGARPEAEKTLQRLLQEAPDNPDYLNFYGYLLAEEGRELDRAESLVRRALEQEPENGAYIDSMGWIHYQRGDHEAALEQLIRAVNILGDDPVVLEHLGDCLRELGRVEEARRTYERALRAGADEGRISERLESLEDGS